jgi:hypothetical protein
MTVKNWRIAFLRNTRKTGTVSSAPPKGPASFFPHWRRAAAPFALLSGLLLCAGSGLRAQIVSDAMLTFPAQTEMVEYDNLAALRALPNYDTLRQRFSGKPLEQVKAALSKLGIPENQVTEIVVGSSPGAFYGLAGGTFNGSVVAKSAVKKGILPVKVDENQLFCPTGTVCLVFLEESVVAFGTSGQLKKMLESRQGVTARLGSRGSLVYLMNKTDSRAPVRGVSSGSQLEASIKDALQDQSGMNIDWSQLSSNINAFGYSVSLDSIAHVTATLECKSQTTAVLLRQMLSALGGLQSMAAHAGKDAASMPFQNMQVSSSGNIIDLKMDAPVGGA